MAILPISSTLIVLRCTGNEDIISELVKQEDSEREAFGAAPHVSLTLMYTAKQELRLSLLGPCITKEDDVSFYIKLAKDIPFLHHSYS